MGYFAPKSSLQKFCNLLKKNSPMLATPFCWTGPNDFHELFLTNDYLNQKNP